MASSSELIMASSSASALYSRERLVFSAALFTTGVFYNLMVAHLTAKNAFFGFRIQQMSSALGVVAAMMDGGTLDWRFLRRVGVARIARLLLVDAIGDYSDEWSRVFGVVQIYAMALANLRPLVSLGTQYAFAGGLPRARQIVAGAVVVLCSLLCTLLEFRDPVIIAVSAGSFLFGVLLLLVRFVCGDYYLHVMGSVARPEEKWELIFWFSSFGFAVGEVQSSLFDEAVHWRLMGGISFSMVSFTAALAHTLNYLNGVLRPKTVGIYDVQVLVAAYKLSSIIIVAYTSAYGLRWYHYISMFGLFFAGNMSLLDKRSKVKSS